jgi:RNA polymerase sigma factor (sigma-70 family)
LWASESNIVVMAETIDDEYLVKQFIQGDKSAFETIFKRHSADVAVLANRLLGWPGDIEDIVQDVFLSAFMSLKKFRCECSLKTWLFTITINKCRSYRYKRLLRLKIFSQAAAETPFAQYQSGDKSSMDFETFDHVRQAVKALPVKCREPIVLKYLQELSTDEICGILGISNNALQVRLHRARQLLKQHLAELMEKD